MTQYEKVNVKLFDTPLKKIFLQKPNRSDTDNDKKNAWNWCS